MYNNTIIIISRYIFYLNNGQRIFYEISYYVQIFMSVVLNIIMLIMALKKYFKNRV